MTWPRTLQHWNVVIIAVSEIKRKLRDLLMNEGTDVTTNWLTSWKTRFCDVNKCYEVWLLKDTKGRTAYLKKSVAFVFKKLHCRRQEILSCCYLSIKFHGGTSQNTTVLIHSKPIDSPPWRHTGSRYLLNLIKLNTSEIQGVTWMKTHSLVPTVVTT